MNSFGSALLTDVYNRLDLYFIILVRLAGFITILPVFTGNNFPTQAKIGFSVFVSYLLFSSGKITVAYSDLTVLTYITILVTEFTVGFILAFVVYMFFSLIYFAGQLMDFQVGFSMVSVFDPLSQIQVPILGNMFYLVITIFLVQSGGLNAILAAFFYSYEALPINSAILLENGKIVKIFVDFILKFYSTGIQIALPVVGSILIVDVALGLLVKAVPQMNVFVVGMPIKLLVGLFVIIYIVPLISSIYSYTFDESYRTVMKIMGGMSP